MPPAIETYALTKRFRKLHSYRDLLLYPWRPADHLAVEGVSLRVGQGELFGLLGQNGAGKTTLIKMLCTSLLPSAGSAQVAGYDVVREGRQVRSAIGLISAEERSFYWRLTGRQNLEFFAAIYHLPPAHARRRIDHLLKDVDLVDHADRPFQTYSTGMRQKLAIARGLLHEPQVLFMDEPTRSLDPIAAQAVRRFVAEYIVGELGRTVVLATHSMAEAEELCDRVALIRGGRIVIDGSVDQLRRALDDRVRCELHIADMPPELPELLQSLPGVLDLTVGREGQLCVLRVSLSEEGLVLAAVLRAVVESGAGVHRCSTRQVSLEEIYMRTLGDPAPIMEPS
ncbi:MAG TPA: ABC transporter ATP-binding protein [Herpetosiphonaceae bacterium]|nr:ABC transporter ATP-binding protein [Herpetosiphonaceae bacterium]